MSTAKTAPPPVATPRRPWVARHKILTTVLLLFVVIVVAGGVKGWPLVRAWFHPQYQAALDEIRKSPVVRERLGEPIAPVRPLPSGDFTDTTAKLTFEVEGPKDRASVSTFSRHLNGQWGIVSLDLTLASNGERIDLKKSIQQGGDDTPKFDPHVKQPDVARPDLPVDIQLPDLQGPPGK